MKKVAAVTCALFVLALAAGMISSVVAADKTHEVKGEVVSVDLQGKMLTFKDDTGANKTAPVTGKGLDTLKTLKAGDKVTLTCTDNEKGEHQGISAIKVEPKAPTQ
jgi:hypothetical protein